MKTIFITGGATGIGRACVRKFLQEGYNVAFMDINSEAATAVVATENSAQLYFIYGNTAKKADIAHAAAAAAARFGSLNALFVNAGIHRSNTVLDISDEELDLMIHTNLYGSINTLRVVTPFLVKAGGGSIVINASDQVFIGKAHSFAYGLIKGALGQATRSLSVDLAPHHIRVNAVCPGTIATPLVDGVFARTSAKTHQSIDALWAEENALFARGSVGTPQEVADLVYFLTETGTFCTGGQYLIDGGLSAGL